MIPNLVTKLTFEIKEKNCRYQLQLPNITFIMVVMVTLYISLTCTIFLTGPCA